MIKPEVDLSVYYSTGFILSTLCMVYLTYKDRDSLIELSINSMYMISNLAILSLILGSVIYIVANFLSFYTPSFSESFILSRNIFGVLLTLNLTVYMIKKVHLLRKKPKELCEASFSILSCLIVLAFFYKVIFVIFGAVFLILGDVDFTKIKYESKHKRDTNVQIEDKSLNHHFKKYYPIIGKAKGNYLFTDDGRVVFDACSGAVVASIGYGNQEVIDAIYEKYKSGTHYLASSF